MRWWGWVLVVLGGLWLVGVAGDGGVAVLVVAIAALVWGQAWQRRVAALEARVRALEAQLGVAPPVEASAQAVALQPETPVEAPVRPAAIARAAAPPEPADTRTVAVEPSVPDAPAAEVAAPLARPPFVAPPPERPASVRPTAADDEGALATTTSIGASLRAWLRGGNAIVRVAVLILFIGVAFLLRYAAEHTTVPIEWRLAGVALGGVALVLVGVRLTRARRGYGLSLQGAGSGVVFLVLFAAYRLYDLLPGGLAFALLVGMAVVTALLAVWQDAIALAVLGFAGAFLAPVLASSGGGSHVGLFSYFLVLNLAIAWISTRQSWKLLNLVGFGFTFGIAGLWGATAWEPRHFWTTEPFLIVHFLLYLAIGVGYTRRLVVVTEATDSPEDGAPTVPLLDAGLLFGVPLAAFGLQAAMLNDQPLALAASAAVMSAIYLGVGRWLWQQAGERVLVLVEALLALGVVFLALVTPLALDARWTGIAWGVQGAGIVWIGLRQQRWWAMGIGLLLQFGAAISLWALSPAHPGLLGPTVLALAAGVSAWLLQRASRAMAPQLVVAPDRPSLDATLLSLHHLMLAGAVAQAWAGGWLELRDVVGHEALLRLDAPLLQVALSLAFVLVLPWLARRLDWPLLDVPARVLLQVALLASAGALGLSIGRTLGLTTGWPRYDLTRVAEIVALVAAGLWLAKRLDRPAPIALRRFELLTLAWVAMAHGGLALYTLAWQQIARHEAWSAAAAILLPTLIALGLLQRQRAGRFPLASPDDAPRPAPLATFGAGLHAPWAFALALWSLAVNLLSDGSMRPLPYVPLLNPIDLAHLLGLLYGGHWLRAQPISGGGRKPLMIGAAALGFVWLNGVLVRTLHHWAGTPGWTDGALGDPTVQTGLTVLWTVIALVTMLIATRRAGPASARPLWMAGAALLAAVVLKLFVIDLSSVGTLARIVSFLGVGALMLVIGYVSPMPPAAARAGGERA